MLLGRSGLFAHCPACRALALAGHHSIVLLSCNINNLWTILKVGEFLAREIYSTRSSIERMAIAAETSAARSWVV
jgi:hypothetical protein